MLLANKHYVIDPETFKFVHTRNCGADTYVDVPLYFWPAAKVMLPKSRLTQQRTIELNELLINFKSFVMQDGVLYFDYHECFLDFKDRGETKSLVLAVNPLFSHVNFLDVYSVQLRSVQYELFMNMNKISEHSTRFFTTQVVVLPRFNSYPELAELKAKARSVQDRFSFGITQNQCGVVYKGQKLNRKFLVMMCGTYAVLLTDDMKFDSLAVLDQTIRGMIFVDKFLYSVNPYIVKLITLLN